MSEQRAKAYADLIEKLRLSTSGQERDILQQNSHLIDRGLLNAFIHEIGKLQAEEKGENRERMQLLSAQLSEYLSFETGTLFADNIFASLATARNFLLTAFQYIQQYQNDRSEVVQFLTAYQTHLNTELLITLPIVTSELLRSKHQGQRFFADIFTAFGDLVAQLQAGQQEINFELAIAAYQQALTAYTHDKSPAGWFGTQYNLGRTYRNRILGDRADNIEKAIAAYQASLLAIPHAKIPQAWGMAQFHLGNTYRERIEGDKGENLTKAITAYQESLKEYTREQVPDLWAAAHKMIGHCYFQQTQGERARNLMLAITAFENALQIFTPERHPEDWANIQLNLGQVFLEEVLPGQRSQNQEKAITAFEKALTIYKFESFPYFWADVQFHLGLAYSELVSGNYTDNQEKALAYCQQALTVFTLEEFPADWAHTQGCLGNIYNRRTIDNHGQNLEQAITAYEKALQVLTRGDSGWQWGRLQVSLANAYTNRVHGDRPQNIEQALFHIQQAMQVLTRDRYPVDWAMAQHHLGLVYRDRLHGDTSQNLEQVIITQQNALKIYSRESHPIEWGWAQQLLGEAYSVRTAGDRTQNIEKAIEALKCAFAVFESEDFKFESASTCDALGRIYQFRIERDLPESKADWQASIHWQANIKEAIDWYSKALELCPRDTYSYQWGLTCHNLGTAYWFSYIADLADAGSEENVSSTALQQVFSTLQQALEVFSPDQFPNDCRRTAAFMGDRYSDNQQWPEAAWAYELALQAAENLYQSSLLQSSQDVELSASGSLFRQAAFALAKIGNLEQAVEMLEQGRARGLSKVLQRDRVDLSSIAELAPDIYQQYLAAADALRQVEADERTVSAWLRQADQSLSYRLELGQQANQVRQEFKEAITAIRQLEGYEEFFADPDFEDILAALTPHQPIIYLLYTSNGGLSLIIHEVDNPEKERNKSSNYQIEAVWLPHLKDSLVETWIVGDGKEHLGWFEAYNNKREQPEAWLSKIDQITRQLWNSLMEPIVNYLEVLEVSQAVLIPTGNLGLFPLHAAWTEDMAQPTGRRYALDKIAFSVVPNARTLKVARAITHQTAATSLLAVHDPQPTSASALPNVEREMETAIACFPNNNQLLHREQANRDAVLKVLPNHKVLHFSCHGFVNSLQPLNSGLLMANDETLSLRDFFNLRLQGVRLAILSACETGLPGADLPDEVVSLPTGLLQAGVAGVIASLWAVSDLSTMLLLSKFYELWRIESQEPPEALRQAQSWMRDSTESEIAPLLGRRTRNPTNRPFSHPYYWAAFSYTGV